MNVVKLQNQIKDSIKSKKLRDYLLMCLKNECALNSLSATPFFIEKAKQRFKNKIKACQRIEKDLSNEFIFPGSSFLLPEKLDTLRLNLAILYADKIDEITEGNYTEIKAFISKFLNFENINLKLKIFDLTIKLLEKINKFPYSSKKFIGFLDLLKLFVNEPHFLSIADLKYINNLDHGPCEKEIKKCFYEIIRELNKKLLFQDLLNQLLIIIKENNNSSLLQFALIFINNCNKDPKMDVDDFSQLIGLVFRALQRYESVTVRKGFPSIGTIFNQKRLGDYLVEFEKDFIEKTAQQINNVPIRLDFQEDLSDLLATKSQESDVSIYFPAFIENEKLQVKFYETKSKILEKNINPHNSFMQYLTNRLEKISATANELKTNAKVLAVDTKENLKEITGTSIVRLKEFITKKTEDSYLKENGKIAENDHKYSLMQTELSSIKEKLNAWNSILSCYTEHHDNKIGTVLIDLDQRPELLVSTLRSNIDEEFNKLTRRTLDEFENINATIKRKGYWLAKSEINKPSFIKKLLHRGCFNIDFSVKKIKSKLNDTPSFSEITNLISKRSFWTLLFTFGIVRWPWMDKAIFAHNWAEQFGLPEVISEIERLKTLDSNEEFLEKVITLSKGFLPYNNQAIVQILNDFKSYIVIVLERLETITQKIENSLSENRYTTYLGTPTSGFFGKKFISSNSEVNSITNAAILLPTH